MSLISKLYKIRASLMAKEPRFSPQEYCWFIHPKSVSLLGSTLAREMPMFEGGANSDMPPLLGIELCESIYVPEGSIWIIKIEDGCELCQL